jgi:membrane protein implicated in regulation of membrane protease activity
VTNNPPSPERDDVFVAQPATSPRANSWLSILLAAIVALFLLAGLFLLMIQLGGPLAIATVVILIPVGLVAFLHYIVWGWWLSATIRDEVEAEERDAARRQTNPSEP